MSNNGKSRTFAEAAGRSASRPFRCAANAPPASLPTRLAAAALGGILFGISFPPFSVSPAAWVAFVPLLLSWESCESGRASFTEAYAAFLIGFAVAFQWPLFHTFTETALLSLPGLLIIPMWMASPFGLSALFRRRLGLGWGLLAFAALYLLMEFALRRGPLAFPWTLLGHSQAEWDPINRLASVGGVPLLSGVVLALNTVFYALARRARRPAGSVAVALLAVVAVAGARSDHETGVAVSPIISNETESGITAGQSEGHGATVAIGVVQPAVSAERWSDVMDTTRVHELLRLSSDFGVRPDLVVWPETALPPAVGKGADARTAVSRWVDSTGVPLLAGAVEPSDLRGLYYNTAILFRPGLAAIIYRKRRLVPFAERVPFQEKWPAVRRLAIPSGGVAGYLPGTDGRLLEIRGARFGVQICFETLFDDASREYARRGADFIIAITQDGWWGDSFGLRQHLAFNRLRALETDLPLVQASVSGLSAVVSANGTIRHRTRWMERRTFVAHVETGSGSTPFVRFGDWITPAAALVVVFVIVLLTAKSLT